MYTKKHLTVSLQYCVLICLVVKAVAIVTSVHFNYQATFFIVSHVLSTIKCVTYVAVKPGFQDKEKVSLFYE